MTTAITATPDSFSAPASKSKLRYVTHGIRILLGLLFFVDGLNGLFPFVPQPSMKLAPGAIAFATALVATGYMMTLIAITQLIVGVLLLSNRFVPLALVILFPFMVNSLAFHFVLEHTGLPMSLGVFALQMYLVWNYRHYYREVLTARTTPGARQA